MTVISDFFGVERVHVPKSQTCRGCCRVHDSTDILFTRYRFEPQTSIRPETFYDRSMLNSIMKRQVTSMQLEATSKYGVIAEGTRGVCVLFARWMVTVAVTVAVIQNHDCVYKRFVRTTVCEISACTKHNM